MSIGMYFYLVDLLFIFKLISTFIVLGIVFGYFIIRHDSYKNEHITYLKICIIPWLFFLVFAVFIPSERTLYVMIAEKAVHQIAENEDNKEIITLIKQITVQKLLETAKGGK